MQLTAAATSLSHLPCNAARPAARTCVQPHPHAPLCSRHRPGAVPAPSRCTPPPPFFPLHTASLLSLLALPPSLAVSHRPWARGGAPRAARAERHRWPHLLSSAGPHRWPSRHGRRALASAPLGLDPSHAVAPSSPPLCVPLTAALWPPCPSCRGCRRPAQRNREEEEGREEGRKGRRGAGRAPARPCAPATALNTCAAPKRRGKSLGKKRGEEECRRRLDVAKPRREEEDRRRRGARSPTRRERMPGRGDVATVPRHRARTRTPTSTQWLGSARPQPSGLASPWPRPCPLRARTVLMRRS
ncbi:uncharacterized protein LOC120645644 [Panicum virgatum]|uniref:uncharacterized protein LOC120645644 n=1 Tax=Panicum virgatum TaxID=38727 RepID=UPI0019D667B7|nr:uncharacterized protein LOC120645644 [Panicum virgatum]